MQSIYMRLRTTAFHGLPSYKRSRTDEAQCVHVTLLTYVVNGSKQGIDIHIQQGTGVQKILHGRAQIENAKALFDNKTTSSGKYTAASRPIQPSLDVSVYEVAYVLSANCC